MPFVMMVGGGESVVPSMRAISLRPGHTTIRIGWGGRGEGPLNQSTNAPLALGSGLVPNTQGTKQGCALVRQLRKAQSCPTASEETHDECGFAGPKTLQPQGADATFPETLSDEARPLALHTVFRTAAGKTMGLAADKTDAQFGCNEA